MATHVKLNIYRATVTYTKEKRWHGGKLYVGSPNYKKKKLIAKLNLDIMNNCAIASCLYLYKNFISEHYPADKPIQHNVGKGKQ